MEKLEKRGVVTTVDLVGGWATVSVFPDGNRIDAGIEKSGELLLDQVLPGVPVVLELRSPQLDFAEASSEPLLWMITSTGSRPEGITSGDGKELTYITSAGEKKTIPVKQTGSGASPGFSARYVAFIIEEGEDVAYFLRLTKPTFCDQELVPSMIEEQVVEKEIF